MLASRLSDPSENVLIVSLVHELADAWWHGVPVAMLDADGRCRHVAGLLVFSERVRTAWRAGALVPGRPLVLADVLRDR